MIGVLGTVAQTVGFVRDIAKSLGANTNGLDKTVIDLNMMLVRMAAKQQAFDLFAPDVADQIDDATKPIVTLGEESAKAADALNEMYTNLPSGFKVKRFQFGADDGGFGANGNNGGGTTSGTGESGAGSQQGDRWYSDGTQSVNGTAETAANDPYANEPAPGIVFTGPVTIVSSARNVAELAKEIRQQNSTELKRSSRNGAAKTRAT